jgi:hypothetical protein
MNNGTEQKSDYKFFKDRTTSTLILAVIMLIIMGSLRPYKPKGLTPTALWADMTLWKECADIVIAGDSRTMMGLSPFELEKIYPQARIKNYSFGSNWFSKEYLQAIEDLLDKKNNRIGKRIFLGITPNLLTDRPEEMGGHFMMFKKRPMRDVVVDKMFAPVIEFFEPLPLFLAARGAFPSLSPKSITNCYYENGFVSWTQLPVTRKAIKMYVNRYKETMVSDKVIDYIIQYVSKWTKEGIIVYGFIMPTCEEMAKLEAERSGLNEEKLKKRFNEAGGFWVDVNKGGYESFDGSHLQEAAAVQFSKDMAAIVSEIERKISLKNGLQVGGI